MTFYFLENEKTIRVHIYLYNIYILFSCDIAITLFIDQTTYLILYSFNIICALTMYKIYYNIDK